MSDEFDIFEEWIKVKHPEYLGLLDEFTQYMNKQREEAEKSWGVYLDKWGRESECPTCKMPILYIQPQPENFPDEAELFIPCLNGCGLLIVRNEGGNINSKFIQKSQSTTNSEEK